MSRYRTIDGDMVDAICKAHYGDESMMVAVYQANPGLAAKGPVLPMGLVIELPEQNPTGTRTPIRLWG